MNEIPQLSRRERQIMDVVYALGSGTVRQIQAQLPDPPTDMAVRRMLHILEDAGSCGASRPAAKSSTRQRNLVVARASAHCGTCWTLFSAARLKTLWPRTWHRKNR